MSTAFYVYKHPSTFEKWENMTYEKCVAEKIFIGVRSAGRRFESGRHEIHFTWAINPFVFMQKYYGDFYWIIDEHGNAMHCWGLCTMLKEADKVIYEGDFTE